MRIKDFCQNRLLGSGIPKLKSSICKEIQLESACFQSVYNDLNVRKWFDDFAEANNIFIPPNILHRKSWEYVYIVIALKERGMLQEGKSGLGFAVGTEPLPAYFASKGCNILATDLGSDNNNASGWITTGQNASGNIEILNRNNLCSKEVFNARVTYRNLDMNNIPSNLNGFDFCWSSCAIEHVGSLEKSKLFIKNMMNTLKPGGIAIHTTEFNLSSDEDTIVDGESVIYRKKDVLEIAKWLKAQGHEIDLDFSLGKKEGDMFTDQPPYYQINPKYHLRLKIGDYDSTSIGLIIKKTKRVL